MSSRILIRTQNLQHFCNTHFNTNKLRNLKGQSHEIDQIDVGMLNSSWLSKVPGLVFKFFGGSSDCIKQFSNSMRIMSNSGWWIPFCKLDGGPALPMNIAILCVECQWQDTLLVKKVKVYCGDRFASPQGKRKQPRFLSLNIKSISYSKNLETTTSCFVGLHLYVISIRAQSISWEYPFIEVFWSWSQQQGKAFHR